MARSASAPPTISGLTFERTLGSGGFSDVYLYAQELPKRQVAVKVLSSDDVSEQARQAFVDEANLMAQLSAHPYIVTIFNAAIASDGRPYFVMEYCPGPSLSQQYRYRRFTIEDVLRTGIRLTSAVATAHAAGILHRDIKPANVLTNAYGWPALADFGISSVVGTEHAHGSNAVGMSIPWSPPELFDDEPHADVRSDVFALAATVHTLLAGRSPFEVPGRSNGSIDLISRIERGAVTPLDRDDVPASLRQALERGMAPRREDRFPSATDFGRTLQRVEMELSYAPTTLDVPNLTQERPDTDDSDADATRIRPVTPVTPDPARPDADRRGGDPAAHRGGGGGDAPGPASVPHRPGPAPAEDDATRIRPHAITPAPRSVADAQGDATVRRGPQTVAGAQAGRSAQGGTSADGSVSVGGRAASADEPLDDGSTPASRRRRMLVVVSTLVVVALAAAIVAASFVFGGDDEPAPVATDTGSPLTLTDVPAPTRVGTTASRDGKTVTFEWSNPDPQKGDSYVWRLSDEGEDAEKHTTVKPEATVTRDDRDDKVCVTVSISRANGKSSTDPLEMCST